MENVESFIQIFVHIQNRSNVPASVAVVRRREHSNHVALMSPVVAVHDELMGTGDADEVIGVVELFRYVLTE